MKFEKDFLRSTDFGLLLLRIALGGLMLFHGMHKLIYGVGFIGDMLAAIGLPSFIAYGSLLAELVASLMIICGIWTRLASVVFAGNMVVAILMAHASEMFSLSPMTGGLVIELPLLYLLGAAVLCLTGGGRFAVTKGTVLD
ncbi:DoxX family protein [Marseilla massiliensis]|uniref:DoxX family protein n=1 Tax=Marseilla massiliensis TaxID=1841864 RepID=A0A939B5Z5_9BACT|nr:DoxX family protein [Marseilla massiliensis]MBM6662949.1 DoxX family protein [Marseilla massiliensis]